MLAEIQQGTFDRLTADAGVSALVQAIHSGRAPQAADGQVNSPFPYLVISGVTAQPWDTKDTLGRNVIMQVDCYARTQSDLAFRAILDAVHMALHRQPLTVGALNWVDTQAENLIEGFEDDGKTRRAVMDFRVIVTA